MKHTYSFDFDLDVGYLDPAGRVALLIETTVAEVVETRLQEIQFGLCGSTEPVRSFLTGVETTNRCEGCDEQLDPDTGLCPLNAAAAADPELLGCGQGGYYGCDEHGIYERTPGERACCPYCLPARQS